LGKQMKLPGLRAYFEIHKKERRFRESNISGNDQVDAS